MKKWLWLIILAAVLLLTAGSAVVLAQGRTGRHDAAVPDDNQTSLKEAGNLTGGDAGINGPGQL